MGPKYGAVAKPATGTEVMTPKVAALERGGRGLPSGGTLVGMLMGPEILII